MHAGDLPIFSIGEVRERHGPIGIASPFIEIEGIVESTTFNPSLVRAMDAISSLDSLEREPANRTCLSPCATGSEKTKKSGR